MNYEYIKETKEHYCILCRDSYFKKCEVKRHFKTKEHNIQFLLYWCQSKFNNDLSELFLLDYPLFMNMNEEDKMIFVDINYDNFIDRNDM